MPHLQVKGVIAAIAKAGCPVALIANILECRESHGLGLQDVANRFIQQWHNADASIALPELMVLGNQRFLSIEKYVGEFAISRMKSMNQPATPVCWMSLKMSGCVVNTMVKYLQTGYCLWLKINRKEVF